VERLKASSQPISSVQDGQSGKEGAAEAVTFQITKIIQALHDHSPQVRAAVAWGACQLMSKWWEFLWDNDVQTISRLTATLLANAFDADCTKSRVAVLEGLAVLVENPMVCSSSPCKHAQLIAVARSPLCAHAQRNCLRTTSLYQCNPQIVSGELHTGIT
jgi:hypothetical protein